MRKSKTANTKLHHVTIMSAGPGAYTTEGAVSLPAAFNPMRAAALALLARGASPDDRLSADGGVTISPVSLARVVAPYTAPRINRHSPVAALNVDA
jgi:hypothetical protein